MRPDTFDSPEIQPAQARLILALALSFALHLALIFLLHVRPVTRPETRIKVLQVALFNGKAAPGQKSSAAPSPSLPAQEPAATPERAQPDEGSPDDAAAPSAPPAASMPPMPSPQLPLPALEMPLVEDPTFYTAKQVDVHPAAVGPVRPEFPDTAVTAGTEGYVTLRLLIDDGGAVREISVVEAQPPDTFEAAAMNAFRNARFSPAQRNGRPVKSDVLIRVTFELVNHGEK